MASDRLKGNAVKVGNSSRCCESRLTQRRYSPHWPLFASRTGRRGELGQVRRPAFARLPDNLRRNGLATHRHHRSVVSYWFPKRRCTFKRAFCPTLANETEPYDPLFFIRFHILVLPSFGASPPFSTHRAGVNHGIMRCGMYGVRPDRADRYDVARPGVVYLQRRQFHLRECLTVLLRHHQ